VPQPTDQQIDFEDRASRRWVTTLLQASNLESIVFYKKSNCSSLGPGNTKPGSQIERRMLEFHGYQDLTMVSE